MDIEEIKSKYKSAPLWKRWSIAAVLCIIPSGLQLLQSGEELLDAKDSILAERDAMDQKFKDAMKRKAELPQLEETLSQTEVEMQDARKALPDEFHMDQILEKTSVLAEDNSINLLVFDPQDEVASNTAFKYVQLPIRLEASGTFSNVVKFYDRIVHMDLLTHIHNFSFRLDNSKGDASKEKDYDKLSTEQKQQLARETTLIQATCDMVIFRTMTDIENKSIEDGEQKTNETPEPKTKGEDA